MCDDVDADAVPRGGTVHPEIREPMAGHVGGRLDLNPYSPGPNHHSQMADLDRSGGEDSTDARGGHLESINPIWNSDNRTSAAPTNRHLRRHVDFSCERVRLAINLHDPAATRCRRSVDGGLNLPARVARRER